MVVRSMFECPARLYKCLRHCVVVLCLFVVVFGLRCTTSADAACGFLYLAFTLFLCCSGCEVVMARVTSSALSCND